MQSLLVVRAALGVATLVALAASALGKSPRPPGAPSRPATVSQRQDGITLTRPAILQDGMLLVVELTTPAECTAPQVRWGERNYKTYATPAAHHALLPVELGAEVGPKTLLVLCPGRTTSFELPLTRGKFRVSKLKVDPRFSEPPPPRAATEQAAFDQAFAESAAARLWSSAFQLPARGAATGEFGTQRTFNDVIASRHRGVDIGGDIGAPVHASNSGRVALVANDYFFVGNAVLLDHGDELFTVYMHLSRIDVTPGQRVERGQLLGAIGATGRATGAHLHFGVKLAGVYVNPADLFAYKPPPDGATAAAP